jgi:hypothetical protein
MGQQNVVHFSIFWKIYKNFGSYLPNFVYFLEDEKETWAWDDNFSKYRVFFFFILLLVYFEQIILKEIYQFIFLSRWINSCKKLFPFFLSKIMFFGMWFLRTTWWKFSYQIFWKKQTYLIIITYFILMAISYIYHYY